MAKDKGTMEFWDSVTQTNPDDTKHVNARGGFTAIDAYSQIKRCTELWGPMGNQWGTKDISYQMDGQDVVMSFTFFCPEGEFPVINNAKLKDEDAMKKCYTDSLTKALSFLGFNSDIFLGNWDKTNKYTGKQGNNAPYKAPAPRQEPRTPQAVVDKGVQFQPVTGQNDQHPEQSQYEGQDQGYYQPQQNQPQQQEQAPQDYGTCDHCGAANKWSHKKNTAYCGEMCWNKGG